VSGAVSDAVRAGSACHRQFPAGQDRDRRRGRQLGPRRHGRGQGREPADRDRLSIGFGGTWAARDGQPLADYDETPVAAHLKGARSRSRSTSAWRWQATVWTCDLTHGYISINADYGS
jgi:glutamate N-acetyltransferase/amino-acid N-acetyltransferase